MDAHRAADAALCWETERSLEERCVEATSMLLVEQIQSERERTASLDLLVQLWMPATLRWCRWLCGPNLNPEDLAHDILLILIRDVDRITTPRRFRSWLWGLTWRQIRAEGRRARWRLRRPAPAREPVDLTPGPEQRLRDSQTAALVKQVLDTLPLDSRQLLWLRYVEGLSRAEIAGLLEIPEGTLGRRLTRARSLFDRRAAQQGLREDARGPNVFPWRKP